MAKSWNARVAHVPHGTPYAVENSGWFLRLLIVLKILWIDLDGHVTRDGVPVCGHWNMIVKNGYRLPAWFKKLYGAKAMISNVKYADLIKLRSEIISYRGRRRYRFISLWAAMAIAVKFGRRIMYEQKGDQRMRQVTFWQNVGKQMVEHKLPEAHFVVATLPTMAGAKEVLMAAHQAGRQTMVIRAQDGVPRSWEPYMTFYRGKIKWIEGK